MALKRHDYGEWRGHGVRGERSGMVGPYGLEGLARQGFRITWSDASNRLPWSHPAVFRSLRKLSVLRPELAGAQVAAASARAVANSDLVLTIFEDQGLFAAWARQKGLEPYAGRPLAIMSCFLAETVNEMDDRSVSAIRDSLAHVDRLLYFSSNQRSVYEDVLGVHPDRLTCLDLGIDSHFFKPGDHPDEGYVFAIGRDSHRDYAVLVDAVSGTDIPLLLVAPNFKVPVEKQSPNIRVITEEIDHLRYRELLERAAMVAVTTTAPAYPSGQTSLLEAMAAGKPVVMTDSPAIRDYVTDDTGVLVPSRDPARLRSAIEGLLADADRRKRMGAASRKAVEETFNQNAMWARVAESIRPLVARAT